MPSIGDLALLLIVALSAACVGLGMVLLTADDKRSPR
jgi:hypothetical protein